MKPLAYVVGAVACGLGYFAAQAPIHVLQRQSFRSLSDDQVAQTVALAAKIHSAGLPKKVEEGVTAISVEAQGKVLVYTFAIDANLDPAGMEEVRDALIYQRKGFCSRSNYGELLKKGAMVKYRAVDLAQHEVEATFDHCHT
jgi:hypothetical protein